MKFSSLFEGIVQVDQSVIWHITEESNYPSIKRTGLQTRKSGIHGPVYEDHSLFFFTKFDQEVIEELEMMVRFGGNINFDDTELMNKRSDIPLVILEIDMDEVHAFDQKHRIRRVWRRDTAVVDYAGVWTNNPIPPSAISVRKHL